MKSRLKNNKKKQEVTKSKTNPSQISDEGCRTDKMVAKKMGIGSKDTYHKNEYIVDNKDSFTPEDFADWGLTNSKIRV